MKPIPNPKYQALKMIFKTGCRWQLLLCTCYLLLQGNTVFAQWRKYANEFLNIGAGARGLAMGSAQAATAGDATAAYWNPAGLSAVQEAPQAALMHAEYFGQIGNYDFAAVALPTTSGKRTLALTALRFGVDDIPNTLFLVEPDGTINYNNIRSFSSADYAFLVSMGQTLWEEDGNSLRFGFNTKVIHRTVGSFAKAWGFGLDAGLQYTHQRWRLGLVARDLTTTVNMWRFQFTEEEKEALYLAQNDIPVKSTEQTAPRLVAGIAHLFPLGRKMELLAEANADLMFDGTRNTLLRGHTLSLDPKLGLELNINKVVYLRGGINNFQQALADDDFVNQKKVWIYQPSVGAGFRIQNFSIDYAFSSLANQSSPLYSHIFSLHYAFAKKAS
ncbi:putative type IX sorting system protein PorV2 [Cnuella takakiae]|nr:PorV/PorQ family protein [Cnuella takakiae]